MVKEGVYEAMKVTGNGTEYEGFLSSFAFPLFALSRDGAGPPKCGPESDRAGDLRARAGRGLNAGLRA